MGLDPEIDQLLEALGDALNEQRERLQRMSINPKPLAAVERRDNVTALAAARDALRVRTREDRLRVWLALGGTEEEFDEDHPDETR